MKNAQLTISLALAITAGMAGAQAPRPVEAPPPAGSYPGLWSQWRGGERSGHVAGKPWPARLSKANLTRSWRLALGPSYSGPVVSKDTVFTTATEDRRKEVVTAVDRGTGEVRWRIEWAGSMKVPFFASRNGSWIRSTPAFDGSSLYVAGMRDVLVSLEAKTGKERWRVDFTKRFGSGLEAFGFVCSPFVDGDSVYVQTGAGLVSLNKRTGETRWRALEQKGGMFGGAFSSPVQAKLRGKTQLLVQSRVALHGIDPETGADLWNVKVRSFRGMNILTPLPFGDAVFTSAYGGRGHLFELREKDGGFAVQEKWKNRVQAYMTTPVSISGHAYVLLRSKRFCCFDLASGESKWTSPPTGDTYWSLIAQGERILALADSGELYLIAANPEKFEVIDRLAVSESQTWAHLAVDGDQVLIRELDGLCAFTWR